MSLDDETLMAFADEQLPADRAAEVAAAVAADPALAARVEAFRTVRARVGGALRAAAPAPRGDLMDAARAAVARNQATRRAWVPVLAAASLVVAAGAFTLAQRSDPFVGRDGEPRPVLADALAGTPSGGTLIRDRDVVWPLYTVAAADGRPCRAWRAVRGSRGSEGVACHEADGWRVLASSRITAPSGGFTQAGSDEPPAVAAAMDALRPGDPLSAAAEAALIARGWRPAE